MSAFNDFDVFVEEHMIAPEELGEAFAAWLNLQTGWDGKSEKVE